LPLLCPCAAQVGIIALNLIGDVVSAPTEPLSEQYLDTSAPASRDLPYYNRSAAADVADLTLDIHVDAATKERIKELSRAKEVAVSAEDYDEAKRLKYSIERLKVRLCRVLAAH
jgi:hypothetical protein